MTHIALGRWNRLTITRYTDHGAYLDGGEAGEILMPKQYVLSESVVGDEVEVFVYLDQGERLVATTEQALAEVGDFAFLEVAWTNEYGAFLHWGLMKDVFVPFREQKMRMVQGRSYIVYIYIDDETGRIVATAKVDRHLNDTYPPYRVGDAVDILVWQRSDLGFKAIVDNKFSGLIYGNEIYGHIQTGDRLTAYVKQVREDGKIDLSLQALGMTHIEDFAQQLLAELEASGGFLPYNDKSDSQAIMSRFAVSKKAFKRAVGTLYKARAIVLMPDGIRLVKS
ncbi:MAG: S1-like domain-containing RNA-binding protein [Bacteroidales bacterium]|nr:S1-like domain-containing RNA-binding protein [Bacteroidales bacterium]